MGTIDDDILRRASAGEREAQGELLREHAEAVRRHAEARISAEWKARLTAEDVLQATCIDAMRDLWRFEPRGEASFVQWLKRIAERNIIDAVRGLEAEARRVPTVRLVRFGHGVDATVTLVETLIAGDGRSTPSRSMSKGEAERLLEWGLEQLPREHRLVVERYDLQGCKVSAIAAEIGRTEGATYMIRTRAIERLREVLAKKAGGIFTNP